MEKDIRISFRYEEEEYVSAVQWYYFKNIIIKLYILIASILVCTGLYLLFVSFKPVFGLGAVILGSLVYGLSIYIIMINPRKLYRIEPRFKEEFFFTFNEEGVVFQFREEMKNLKWDYYSNFKESKNYFYLIYGKNLFTIIPKKSFKNGIKIDKFRSLLSDNIKSK